jgi:hypothetical protein
MPLFVCSLSVAAAHAARLFGNRNCFAFVDAAQPSPGLPAPYGALTPDALRAARMIRCGTRFPSRRKPPFGSSRSATSTRFPRTHDAVWQLSDLWTKCPAG